MPSPSDWVTVIPSMRESVQAVRKIPCRCSAVPVTAAEAALTSILKA